MLDVTTFNLMFPASLDLTPRCNFFPKFLFPKYTYVSIISLYRIPYNYVFAFAFLLAHARIANTAAVKTYHATPKKIKNLEGEISTRQIKLIFKNANLEV